MAHIGITDYANYFMTLLAETPIKTKFAEILNPMITNEQIKDLTERRDALRRSL